MIPAGTQSHQARTAKYIVQWVRTLFLRRRPSARPVAGEVRVRPGAPPTRQMLRYSLQTALPGVVVDSHRDSTRFGNRSPQRARRGSNLRDGVAPTERGTGQTRRWRGSLQRDTYYVYLRNQSHTVTMKTTRTMRGEKAGRRQLIH